jgi:transposase-like protein
MLSVRNSLGVVPLTSKKRRLKFAILLKPTLQTICVTYWLNNRAENCHQPPRVLEKVMRRFKSVCQRQRLPPLLDQVANQFMHFRYNRDAGHKRELRTQVYAAWNALIRAKIAAV